jgi:hypothetical protein
MSSEGSSLLGPDAGTSTQNSNLPTMRKPTKKESRCSDRSLPLEESHLVYMLQIRTFLLLEISITERPVTGHGLMTLSHSHEIPKTPPTRNIGAIS